MMGGFWGAIWLSRYQGLQDWPPPGAPPVRSWFEDCMGWLKNRNSWVTSDKPLRTLGNLGDHSVTVGVHRGGGGDAVRIFPHFRHFFRIFRAGPLV